MAIGFLSYRCLNIVDANSKQFLSFNLRHSILKNQSKGAGDKIGNYNTAEKSSLKRIRYPLRGFLSEKALLAKKRNQNDSQPNGNSVAKHHRPRSSLDELKCL